MGIKTSLNLNAINIGIHHFTAVIHRKKSENRVDIFYSYGAN